MPLRIAIGERLNVLMPEVERLMAEKTELMARPHPDESFKATVAKLEMRVMEAAGRSWEALRELRAQKVFLSPYAVLSEDTRSGILAGLRDIKAFTTPFFRRFRDSQTKTVQMARETLTRLTDTLDSVVNLTKAKLQ